MPQTSADWWVQQRQKRQKSDIDDTQKVEETLEECNIDDDGGDEVFTCDVCGEEGCDYYTRLRCHAGCGRRACHDCRSWTTAEGVRPMNDEEYFCAVCHDEQRRDEQRRDEQQSTE